MESALKKVKIKVSVLFSSREVLVLFSPGKTLGTYTNSRLSQTALTDAVTSLNRDIRELRLIGVKPYYFNYLAPLEIYYVQKPYHCRLPLPCDVSQSNIATKSFPVTIFDIRGNENLFTLESSGFSFLEIPVSISNWTDDTVLWEYLPLMSRWLKSYFDSKIVMIYTYNVSAQNLDVVVIGITDTL
jgi:hypothetical protein